MARPRAKSTKKFGFRGKVGRHVDKQQRGAQYSHLNLPKGFPIFKEEPKSRVGLDFLPYEVTSEHHMDRDDEYGIAVPGTWWFKLPYFQHRNFGANNDYIVCPTTHGQACPICEHRQKLLAEGYSWNDDEVRALKPSKRNLYLVVPIKHADYEEKPHLWDISQFLFQDKLNEELAENEDWEAFPDPQDGYTVRVRFSEETFGTTKFADTSRIDFVERKKEYDDAFLDALPKLDDVLVVPSYKQVEALFYGGMDMDEEEPDLNDIPFDDEEEDEDDWEMTTEEFEEDEEDDIPFNEEEPEEEIVEEPTPTRTKRAKSAPKTVKKGECPHGYEFGTDCEEYDECDECEEWEECFAAQSGDL